MRPDKILLNAYFEALSKRLLLEQKQVVYLQIEQFLVPDIEKRAEFHLKKSMHIAMPALPS